MTAIPRTVVRTPSVDVSHTWYGSCAVNSGGIVKMRAAAANAKTRIAPGNSQLVFWFTSNPENQLATPEMPSMDLRRASVSRSLVSAPPP